MPEAQGHRLSSWYLFFSAPRPLPPDNLHIPRNTAPGAGGVEEEWAVLLFLLRCPLPLFSAHPDVSRAARANLLRTDSHPGVPGWAEQATRWEGQAWGLPHPL